MKHQLLCGAALSLAIVASASVPAYAASSHNPAGNNGFIKISNEIMPDTIPQNHPHVSCDFSVEFYNYDKNNTQANVSFALQAPTNNSSNTLAVTSGNLKPFIGEDTAGGGNDLDAREYYTLNFTGAAQQNQGYHVKVTVNAPGSKGNDVKHKVFWVEPCATTPVATQTTPTVTTTSTTTAPVVTAPTASVATAPTALPNTGTSAAVLLSSAFVGVLSYAVALRHLRKALA